MNQFISMTPVCSSPKPLFASPLLISTLPPSHPVHTKHTGYTRQSAPKRSSNGLGRFVGLGWPLVCLRHNPPLPHHGARSINSARPARRTRTEVQCLRSDGVYVNDPGLFETHSPLPIPPFAPIDPPGTVPTKHTGHIHGSRCLGLFQPARKTRTHVFGPINKRLSPGFERSARLVGLGQV